MCLPAGDNHVEKIGDGGAAEAEVLRRARVLLVNVAAQKTEIDRNIATIEGLKIKAESRIAQLEDIKKRIQADINNMRAETSKACSKLHKLKKLASKGKQRGALFKNQIFQNGSSYTNIAFTIDSDDDCSEISGVKVTPIDSW